MSYSKHDASVEAIRLVTAALQSQSIKLTGAHSTTEHAVKYATSDAAYLSKLLTDLAASIENLG